MVAKDIVATEHRAGADAARQVLSDAARGVAQRNRWATGTRRRLK
jgi:hypothetical protein